MVSVSPETWDLLQQAYDGGGWSTDFEQAWSNGQEFAHAQAGLRNRRPIIIEWKGSHRAPGDEVAPIDLRIDHVYLISCKYLSKIMINASPSHLFRRLLKGGHGVRGEDWYQAVAGTEYQELYEKVVSYLGCSDLPSNVSDLNQEQRKLIAQGIPRIWPKSVLSCYQNLANVVAYRTAKLWQEVLTSTNESETMLWRILRMGSAPYFILGTSATAPLRLRVATPWDWRLKFRLSHFECHPQKGDQPRVGWSTSIKDLHSDTLHIVEGHVEIRWSHGRFSGNPEAKVYLDTPHVKVPGYFPLR